MAQSVKHEEKIGFKSIRIYRDQTLGIGSYGAVYKAKCDDLLCAAKILHPTLFDPSAHQQVASRREHRLPIRRFEQECEFMGAIKHPNIVQFLGMKHDPDTNLPVLLMELMDDSLTHFLESSLQPVPYHIQVNVCHNITLALSFLHSNNIVHRDLSSNNVLLTGDIRAKVTDFGMAKLYELLSYETITHSTYTMCPGTDVYMPPEAVKENPVYNTKLDCFSFGVIIIQLLTRQFPKPGNRQEEVEINHPGLPTGTVMVCVPEIERRQNHISEINPRVPLLSIALDCLKDKGDERPSAHQLCEQVAALKESYDYLSDPKQGLLLKGQQHTSEIQSFQRIIAEKDQSLKQKDQSIAQLELDNQQLRQQLNKMTAYLNQKPKFDQTKFERKASKSNSRREDSETSTQKLSVTKHSLVDVQAEKQPTVPITKEKEVSQQLREADTHLQSFVHRFISIDDGSHHSVSSLPVYREKSLTADINDPLIQFSLHYDVHQSKLRVHLQHASNLPHEFCKGMPVACDPFVMLHLEPHKEDTFKSELIANSHDPEFNQIFQFRGFSFNRIKHQTLVLRIYNDASSNKFIGKACLPLSDNIDLFGVVIQMKIVATEEMEEKFQGELLVSLCYNPITQYLSGKVHKAVGLRKCHSLEKAAPYVRVTIRFKDNEVCKWKSSVKQDTLTPRFNESFNYKVTEEMSVSMDYITLTLLIIDFDHNDAMGVVHIGKTVCSISGRKHWAEMMQCPLQKVCFWHSIQSVTVANTAAGTMQIIKS